jgi:hypothetical protein
MILTQPRDPRFITIRRGGTLTDADHCLLATWAATCAEHVLHFFEDARPGDGGRRHAVEQIRTWIRGEIGMRQAREAAYYANASARDLSGAPRFAAYAIKAAQAAAPDGERELAGRRECRWQREQLPEEIHELVLDDQRLRNHACWFVFDC